MMKRLGLFLVVAVAACTSTDTDPRLGADGAIVFGYGAFAEQMPVLQLGQAAQQICLWRNDGDGTSGDEGGGFIGDDDEPAFYLSGDAQVRSSSPDVATFTVAGPPGSATSACVTPALHAAGTTRLVIVAADGSEVDHLDVMVTAN